MGCHWDIKHALRDGGGEKLGWCDKVDFWSTHSLVIWRDIEI